MQVAILLPPDPDLGFVWRARAFATALISDTTSGSAPVRVVVGLPYGRHNWQKSAQRLRDISPNVSVRLLNWDVIDSTIAANMHDVESIAPEGVENVLVPRDAGWSFRDCDRWILCPVIGAQAIADVVPAVVYCRELTQRYIPVLVGTGRLDPRWTLQTDGFRDLRARPSVMATDPRTRSDLASYAGVQSQRITSIPSIWNYFSLDVPARKGKAPANGKIVLVTGSPTRDDLPFVFEAYSHYLLGGGSYDLAIAGHPTARSWVDYLLGQRSDLPKSVTDRIRFQPVEDDDDIAWLGKDAVAIWSATLADAEPDAPAIAAQLQVPLIAGDYPLFRDLVNTLGLTATLYPPSDVKAAVSGLEALSLRPNAGNLPSAVEAHRNASARQLAEAVLMGARND